MHIHVIEMYNTLLFYLLGIANAKENESLQHEAKQKSYAKLALQYVGPKNAFNDYLAQGPAMCKAGPASGMLYERVF